MVTFDVQNKLVDRHLNFIDVVPESQRAHVTDSRSFVEKMVESGFLIPSLIQFL